MMYASEDLRNEHKGILFGLEILEQMVNTFKRSDTVDTKDIDEMVNFLRLFADKCHHGKEEGLMFPAMEKVGIPNERGPIGQMLIEHNQGRHYISEMGKSTENNTLQGSLFVEAAKGYINLMRAHIEKENSVLFPMGDQKIPMDVQAQLLEQFEGFEEEIMGKGTHEKLHETLHKFEEKYLKSK
ncbi:hemerythrin domain-containing protein [Desulfitobacterium sp. THU1]|uniref:hemerythrin domain-containing protein n=1 Tax=Desulfitobacterium sp. THU1 TaxID=3138072 RepID=UPI00311E2004